MTGNHQWICRPGENENPKHSFPHYMIYEKWVVNVLDSGHRFHKVLSTDSKYSSLLFFWILPRHRLIDMFGPLNEIIICRIKTTEEMVVSISCLAKTPNYLLRCAKKY